ncbi:alanine dehydrogenase [Vagococcus acidifermentans]|uniref:Alanine dehydrogenase n=1 Tax=Vagococcus acidifermentans TaxID=564710 RepID=A0A430ALV6_9ENTE|nr:alanine dehydrogenase [Vagococcus acidifermentans]RSU09102.1 alanine dehydrogenase [Vagococcus acidifermentans]
MKIGIPKEVLNNENRVAVTPSGVHLFIENNHKVIIQKGAGEGSGFSDEEYQAVGAILTDDIEEVWHVDMVMKVKEPVKDEFKYFHENLIIFTYLHLAPQPELTEELMKRNVATIAYESVKLPDGCLPLLTPMSEIAGRMSAQIGAFFLQKTMSGSGILLSAVPGVERGTVVIIGGGVAGANAAKIAAGLGAKVKILDVNARRLAQLEEVFGNDVETIMSNPYNIAEAVKSADLLIGAVLLPGRKAPSLVTEEMVKEMKPGSVIVDIAIDQGGIFETTDKTTTHDDPTYVKHGVIHYAVPNMPGAVPRTSTFALTNVTLPYALELANKGFKRAVAENNALAAGVNTLNGALISKEVAADQQKEAQSLEDVLAGMKEF